MESSISEKLISIIQNGIFCIKDTNEVLRSNIDDYNYITSIIDKKKNSLRRLLEEDKGEEYPHENYYSQKTGFIESFVDLGKKIVRLRQLFITTHLEVFARYKFINDKKCWHHMKYLKAIQMKYQKLSLIPTQNLDTLASIGRVVSFPIQPIYFFANKYMRLTDGFNCFPLEVQYKCIKCGHEINFTYNMYHDKIVIFSGHFENNKELYGVKNIYSNFDDILKDFYKYSKPYFHKILCGEGYFVEDMYKSYKDQNPMEIKKKLLENEMELLKEDYKEEKKN